MKNSVSVKTNMNLIKEYNGKVFYGVPSEKAFKREKPDANLENSDNTYNNAQILQLMEFGSPINNIPPRKLLEPVLKKYNAQIQKHLDLVIQAILAGEKDVADNLMEKLALRVQNWCKLFFTDEDNNWQPNSPITIYGGWMRNKVSGKPIYIKGKGSDKPLIDTGSLRSSVSAFFSEDNIDE